MLTPKLNYILYYSHNFDYWKINDYEINKNSKYMHFRKEIIYYLNGILKTNCKYKNQSKEVIYKYLIDNKDIINSNLIIDEDTLPLVLVIKRVYGESLSKVILDKLYYCYFVKIVDEVYRLTPRKAPIVDFLFYNDEDCIINIIRNAKFKEANYYGNNMYQTTIKNLIDEIICDKPLFDEIIDKNMEISIQEANMYKYSFFFTLKIYLSTVLNRERYITNINKWKTTTSDFIIRFAIVVNYIFSQQFSTYYEPMREVDSDYKNTKYNNMAYAKYLIRDLTEYRDYMMQVFVPNSEVGDHNVEDPNVKTIVNKYYERLKIKLSATFVQSLKYRSDVTVFLVIIIILLIILVVLIILYVTNIITYITMIITLSVIFSLYSILSLFVFYTYLNLLIIFIMLCIVLIFTLLGIFIDFNYVVLSIISAFILLLTVILIIIFIILLFIWRRYMFSYQLKMDTEPGLIVKVIT